MSEETEPVTIEIRADEISDEPFPSSFFWDERWLLHDHYDLNVPFHRAKNEVQNTLFGLFQIFSQYKKWYSQHTEAPERVVIIPYFFEHKSIEEVVEDETNPNAIQATKGALEHSEDTEIKRVYREILSLQKSLTKEKVEEIIAQFLDEFAAEIADKLNQDEEDIPRNSLAEIIFLFIRPLQELFSPIMEKMELPHESTRVLEKKIETAKEFRKRDIPRRISERLNDEERSLEDLQQALEKEREKEQELRLKWLGRNRPSDVN